MPDGQSDQATGADGQREEEQKNPTQSCAVEKMLEHGTPHKAHDCIKRSKYSLRQYYAAQAENYSTCRKAV